MKTSNFSVLNKNLVDNTKSLLKRCQDLRYSRNNKSITDSRKNFECLKVFLLKGKFMTLGIKTLIGAIRKSLSVTKGFVLRCKPGMYQIIRGPKGENHRVPIFIYGIIADNGIVWVGSFICMFAVDLKELGLSILTQNSKKRFLKIVYVLLHTVTAINLFEDSESRSARGEPLNFYPDAIVIVCKSLVKVREHSQLVSKIASQKKIYLYKCPMGWMFLDIISMAMN